MARYDARNLAQRITSAANSGPILRRHKGKIVDVNNNGTVDLYLDGNETQILSNIPVLGSVKPLAVNDIVEILIDESDVFVLGRITSDRIAIFNGGVDVGLTDGTGEAQFGPSGGFNIGIDGNEIHARIGGAASVLNLNFEGGDVRMGSGRFYQSGQSWIGLSYVNSWGNYGASYPNGEYYKTPDGFVHLHGLITGGTVGTNVATLPSAYRPVDQHIFVAQADGGTVRINLSSDGVLHVASVDGTTVDTAPWVSLSGISFVTF